MKFILFMTVAATAAVVAAPPATTNNTIPAPVTHIFDPGRDSLRWAALSMVESGDCDTCAGAHGEVGRWQMLPRWWRKNTDLPLHAATNPFTALAVAKLEMQRRLHGRSVTDAEWFLTWHCPAHISHPNAEERDYAGRCENVLKKMLTNGAGHSNTTTTANNPAAALKPKP